MSKLNIVVCMGSSCFARGNQENLAFIEEYIEQNGIDANIELEGTRCENKCASGPNIYVNGIEYNEVTIEKLKEILDSAKIAS